MQEKPNPVTDDTLSSVSCAVPRVRQLPESMGRWDDPLWPTSATLDISSFHPLSSAHRPKTQVRLLHDGRTLAILFRVQDRFVRSVHTRPNEQVCEDSCVEFFVQPRPDKGYFNFEVNAGGTMLLYYVEDPARAPDGSLKRFRPVEESLARRIEIHHSLPPAVDPEIAVPTAWTIELRIPVEIMESYIGPLGDLTGQRWRANFYKCGDKTSHPHWGAWSPVGEALNFHQPARFGVLNFD
jgi:hypothetical protein